MPGSLRRGQTGSRPRRARSGRRKPLTPWLFLPEAQHPGGAGGSGRCPEGPARLPGVLSGLAGLSSGGHTAGSLQGLRRDQKPQVRGTRSLQEAGAQRRPRLPQHRQLPRPGLRGKAWRGEAERKPSWKSGVRGLALYRLPGVVSGCRSGGGGWKRPGHFCGSERQSASASPSAHPREPCRTRGDYEGSTRWDAGLTLRGALYLPRPPGGCLVTCQGLCCSPTSKPHLHVGIVSAARGCDPPRPFRCGATSPVPRNV